MDFGIQLPNELPVSIEFIHFGPHILCHQMGGSEISVKGYKRINHGFFYIHKRFFVRYGIPREVVIDGGNQFT